MGCRPDLGGKGFVGGNGTAPCMWRTSTAWPDRLADAFLPVVPLPKSQCGPLVPPICASFVPCCSSRAGLQATAEQLLETAVGLLQQLPVLAEILPAGLGPVLPPAPVAALCLAPATAPGAVS